MLVLLSSAKTLDFESPWDAPKPTQPEFVNEAHALVQTLRTYSASGLRTLLDVNPAIATLNRERYRRFSLPFTVRSAKPALFAYRGDVYRQLTVSRYRSEQLAFAQRTLRILSGLYGVLRPLDFIQPYRLELSTKLRGPAWRDLYAFWSERVTRAIERDSLVDERQRSTPAKGSAGAGWIINLASQEYFRVLNTPRLRARILTLTFKQDRHGTARMVPILAKRARGLMVNFILTRRLADPRALQTFRDGGYQYAPQHSSATEWVFLRRASRASPS